MAEDFRQLVTKRGDNQPRSEHRGYGFQKSRSRSVEVILQKDILEFQERSKLLKEAQETVDEELESETSEFKSPTVEKHRSRSVEITIENNKINYKDVGKIIKITEHDETDETESNANSGSKIPARDFMKSKPRKTRPMDIESDPGPSDPKESFFQSVKSPILPSTIRQFRPPTRSDFDGESREAFALGSMKQKSMKSTTTYGTVYSPSNQRLTELKRMSFAEVVEKITLTWDHVNVYAPIANTNIFCLPWKTSNNGAKDDVESQTLIPNDEPDHKLILRDVSGMVEAGTLLAILGASGAGKTTLLNVLTYRNRGDLIVEGEVKVNGGRIGSAMSSVSSYIQQEDLLLATITVREHLWFQSQLRMNKEIPNEIRKDRVEAVILEMGLTKCADNFIGETGLKNSISGGEKKRLAFAAELLTNPPLLFLDEPTSGLDSYMALNVLMTLKSMARKGRSIICTIHQPSSQLFELFDKLMILSEGRVAYLGPASEAIEFFKSCGYPLPLHYNPADHFIRVMAIEPGREEESKERVEIICDNYMMTKHAKHLREKIEETNFTIDGVMFDEESFADQSPYKASWFKQFYVVFWRCFVENSREPFIFWTRLIQIAVVAVILSLVFWQQKLDQIGVININGVLFLMELQMTVGFLFNIILVLPPAFPLFLKEHFDGMYRADVYFIAKTIVEMPQFIFLPLVFTTILYWSVGLYNSAEAFFICLVCNFMVCNTSVSFGYFISVAINNTKNALVVAPIFVATFITIGGFFVNTESIPVYIAWFKYISWFTYANEILVVNQWSKIDKIECKEGETMCYQNGKEVINSFDYVESRLPSDFVMLLILAVLFRLLALVCFLIRARKSYKLRKK